MAPFHVGSVKEARAVIEDLSSNEEHPVIELQVADTAMSPIPDSLNTTIDPIMLFCLALQVGLRKGPAPYQIEDFRVKKLAGKHRVYLKLRASSLYDLVGA